MTRTTTAFAAALWTTVAIASPAMADVCAQTNKAAADKAAKVLSVIDGVLRYCAPCGDATPSSVSVRKAVAAPVADDATAYEVRVNGKVEDLAYLYVMKSASSKTWVNLGLLTGCADPSAIDILELPPGLAEKAVVAQ